MSKTANSKVGPISTDFIWTINTDITNSWTTLETPAGVRRTEIFPEASWTLTHEGVEFSVIKWHKDNLSRPNNLELFHSVLVPETQTFLTKEAVETYILDLKVESKVPFRSGCHFCKQVKLYWTYPKLKAVCVMCLLQNAEAKHYYNTLRHFLNN